MRNLFLSILALAALGCCGLLSNGKNEVEDEKVISRKTAEDEESVDFTGTYHVYQGEGPTYKLTIKEFEKGYKLKWETADGESWQGSGFAYKGVLAVESGKEPGFFGFYKREGSKLTGIFTNLDAEGYFTERSPGTIALRPSSPSSRNLSGRYNVIGFDGEGEGYEQIYIIKRTGQTYKVFWGSEEDPSLTAAGIASGDFFVSGVGVGGSIVVRIYKVEDSKLDGWYFYTYYDDVEFKEHIVSNGEMAEKE